jgi:ubiquitin-protein ligase
MNLLNKQYKVDWSPAMSLEKVVLNLAEVIVSLKN